MDLSWLGSLIPVFGSLAGAGASIYDTYVDKQTAEKNLAFQQQQFEYQKELNTLTQEREDTAYQRAVADMNAAGLSPLNVNPASAATLNSAPAPQINYQSQVGNAVNQSMDILTNLFNLSIAKKQSDAQQAKTDSETALNLQRLSQLDKDNPITHQILYAQLEGLLSDNILKTNQNNIFESLTKPTLQAELANKTMQNKLQRLDYSRKFNDLSYMSEFGLTDSMSPAERFAAFKSYNKYGRNSNKFDTIKPILEYDPETDSYKLSEYSHKRFDLNNDFVPDILDKDLLQLWMALSGSILPMAKLGR